MSVRSIRNQAAQSEVQAKALGGQRPGRTAAGRPMSRWVVEDVCRIADREHGSLLAAVAVDFDDAVDPDHVAPLGVPDRFEWLA